MQSSIVEWKPQYKSDLEKLTLVIWKGYTNLNRISRHITSRIMPNHSKLMWSDVHGIISILCWQWGCRRRREDWHELNICIHELMFNRPSFSHDTNFSENVQYDQILILNSILCYANFLKRCFYKIEWNWIWIKLSNISLEPFDVLQL